MTESNEAIIDNKDGTVTIATANPDQPLKTETAPVTHLPEKPRPVSTPLIEQGTPKAFAPVFRSANPFRQLFTEFITREITLDETLNAIDASVCQSDALLREYEFKHPPALPEELEEALTKIHAKCIGSTPAKKREIMQAFYTEARQGKFFRHFATVDKLEADNKSNFIFLNQILDRQKDKNAVYAVRIRSVLASHYESGADNQRMKYATKQKRSVRKK